jgi:predicted phosphodiesterase
MDIIKERLEKIAAKDNAFIILNGDIINNATKTSVSDTYAEELSPMEQIERFVELFEPLREKILCVTSGNHENRTYLTQGVDITQICAKQLGVEDRYSKNGAVLFLRVGEMGASEHHRQVPYSFYCNHGGGGGGRKEGAKAIRLADMASIIDVDVYVHGHVHLPMIMKQAFYRTDFTNSSFQKVDKLFVNTSSSLDFGGYGEQYEFKPSSTDSPTIYLDGRKKQFSARL